jgi:hypothetical protein
MPTYIYAHIGDDVFDLPREGGSEIYGVIICKYPNIRHYVVDGAIVVFIVQ